MQGKLKGEIVLKVVDCVTSGDMKHCGGGEYGFLVSTSDRTLNIYADSNDLRLAWVQKVQDVLALHLSMFVIDRNGLNPAQGAEENQSV